MEEEEEAPQAGPSAAPPRSGWPLEDVLCMGYAPSRENPLRHALRAQEEAEEEDEEEEQRPGGGRTVEQRVAEAVERFRQAREKGCSKCHLLQLMSEAHFKRLQEVLLLAGWRSKRAIISFCCLTNRSLKKKKNVWYLEPFGECCRECFHAALDLSSVTGTRWRSELKKKEFLPQVHHGLEGKANNLTYNSEVADCVCEYVLGIVHDFATYSPGRHCRRGNLRADDPATLYLPPSATFSKMWREFCRQRERQGALCPSFRTFRRILSEEFGQRLQHFHRKWGECNICKQFSVGVGPLPMNREQQEEEDALNGGLEDAEAHTELQERVVKRMELYSRTRNDQWNMHLDHAEECRAVYRQEFERARNEYEKLGHGIIRMDQYTPHYTWDFAAPLMLPLDIHQPALYDFVSRRFVRCFGILDDGAKLGFHQLFWEYEQSGNPEVVISLADRFLRQQIGIKRYSIHSDCAAKENRNKTVMFYHAMRILLGEVEEIHHRFMVPGHTKNLLDGRFGVIKNKCKRLTAYSPRELVDALNELEQDRVEWVTIQNMFRWKDLLGQFFIPSFPNISYYHNFLFSSEWPGQVHCWRREGGVPVMVDLLRPEYRTSSQPQLFSRLPEVQASGLKDRRLPLMEQRGMSRMAYDTLRNMIKPLIPPEYHEELCPEGIPLLRGGQK